MSESKKTKTEAAPDGADVVVTEPEAKAAEKKPAAKKPAAKKPA